MTLRLRNTLMVVVVDVVVVVVVAAAAVVVAVDQVDIDSLNGNHEFVNNWQQFH